MILCPYFYSVVLHANAFTIKLFVPYPSHVAFAFPHPLHCSKLLCLLLCTPWRYCPPALLYSYTTLFFCTHPPNFQVHLLSCFPSMYLLYFEVPFNFLEPLYSFSLLCLSSVYPPFCQLPLPSASLLQIFL